MYFFFFWFTTCIINVLEIGSVSYITFTIKERDDPNYFNKKNTERIRICVLFVISYLFRQCHCHNSISLFFVIEERDKPNCFSKNKYWKNKNMRTFFYISHLFRQCHCHKQQIFFLLCTFFCFCSQHFIIRILYLYYAYFFFCFCLHHFRIRICKLYLIFFPDFGNAIATINLLQIFLN